MSKQLTLKQLEDSMKEIDKLTDKPGTGLYSSFGKVLADEIEQSCKRGNHKWSDVISNLSGEVVGRRCYRCQVTELAVNTDSDTKNSSSRLPKDPITKEEGSGNG